MVITILAFAAMTSLILHIVMFVVGYTCVVRPFDRILGPKGLFLEQGVLLFSPLLRTHNYCGRISKPKGKDAYMEMTYGDFDFDKHATPAQRRISYLFKLSAHICMICAFVFFVVEMILE